MMIGESMSIRSQRLLKKWRQTRHPDEDEELTYVCKWVDELHSVMTKHSGDSNFRMDLLDAAGAFFDERLTDGQKRDAFVYTLGLLGRK